MNDKELLDLLFTYLYKHGGCDDIQIALKNEHEIAIDNECRQRLFRIITATEFAKADNYAYGNHLHISLTEEGIRMMTEYESYNNFRNKENHIHEDKKDKTLFTLERISYVACVIGSLVALLSLLYSLLS